MSVNLESSSSEPRIRIGELSRRTGIGVDTLRAWERRYAVLEPIRTPGGFRLYGAEDESRARRMSELIAAGHSAAQAAEAVGQPGAARAPAEEPGGAEAAAPAEQEVEPLVRALVALDERTANSILDRVFAALSPETASRVVILPALREIGRLWQGGEVGIADEHFASNLIRARLLSLSRGWGAGGARHAILACAPGEQHDIALIVFGLALRGRGWRITYLGPDTPPATIEDVAGRVSPDAVVLTSLAPERVSGEAAQLKELARSHRLVLAGPEEVTALAGMVGAESLSKGPVDGARELDEAA